jgi:hypothetical protein
VDNYYADNEDLQFYFAHTDIDRNIALREDGFKERNEYPYAPRDVADARDNYRKILEMVGAIAAENLAPYAAQADEDGVSFQDGVVVYPESIHKTMEAFSKADLMGINIPRMYGGLNVPMVISAMIAEMVTRADGSFINVNLQQNIAETINKFASEELKKIYLPMIARGAVTTAMALTELEAGSDLQAIALRAYQGDSERWYLNGVKRFITNGCADILLILARSEDGAKGGKGLSLFLCKKNERVKVRRVENKLGIHASATCELQFDDAPAHLIGLRKRGLAKYTMWLMNAARLNIAGQAIGVAESAYRAADKYAYERVQFKRPIREMAQIFEMLTEMKVSIEAARSLYYETARIVDLKEVLEDVAEKYPDRAPELQCELSDLEAYVSLMTPMVKVFNAEMVNKVAYDAIQIHGGTGYMKDVAVERHYRDARITNIYEGTTQLQIVSAINGVTSGAALQMLNAYDEEDYSHAEDLRRKVVKAKNIFENLVGFVTSKDDPLFVEYHARRLVEMATDLIQAYLLLRDARHSLRKHHVAKLFINKMLPRSNMVSEFIVEAGSALLEHYKEIID